MQKCKSANDASLYAKKLVHKRNAKANYRRLDDARRSFALKVNCCACPATISPPATCSKAHSWALLEANRGNSTNSPRNAFSLLRQPMSSGARPTSAAKGLPGPKLPESGTALRLGAARGVRPLASRLTRTSKSKCNLAVHVHVS